MHSADNWKIWAVLRSAIRARRMQKDQLRAAHTIPRSHSGRQASSRRPCCHKESAVASRLPNLAGWASTERHRRQLCVSETSLSAPPIEAQLNQPACRWPYDRACGAYCIAAWLSRADRNGSLAAFLKPNLTPPERTLARVEGWILGVPGLIRGHDLGCKGMQSDTLH